MLKITKVFIHLGGLFQEKSKEEIVLELWVKILLQMKKICSSKMQEGFIYFKVDIS